jgi:GR25 family glycosyltransferase involved in LPS biosynthesis
MENIARAFYINLERRKDRREQFEEECRRMDIQVERFPAIPKDPGMLGCHLSHLTVLRKAKEMDLPNVLIFEDDFEFLVDKETFTTQLKAFFDSKVEYDVLFLSYAVQKSEPLNDIVSRGTDVQTASGYIVNAKFYDTLIDNLTANYPLLEATGSHWLYLNDQCWKTIQKDNRFLYFNVRLGKQRNSFSDLRGYFAENNH